MVVSLFLFGVTVIELEYSCIKSVIKTVTGKAIKFLP